MSRESTRPRPEFNPRPHPSRRIISDSPERDREKSAPQGRYDGLYRLDGFTLVRGDGLALVRCYRPGNPGRRGSNYFLSLASEPSRPFVGNLYRSPNLDGAEFDDRVHRYRIEAVNPGQYRIRTLRRKNSRGGRGSR